MKAAKTTLLHRYHGGITIEVVDHGEFRSLYFRDRVVQSRILRQDPARLILRYTQYMMGISLLAQPQPARALLIGVGAGALVQFFHHRLPATRLDAVEYSEDVLKVARGYFNLPESDMVAIHCDDGLRYLANHDDSNKYDLILVDAFNDDGMASTIYSDEFLKLARKNITEGGVICCNLWSGNESAYARVQKAMHKHSKSCLSIPVRGRENVIALLLQTPPPWRSLCPSPAELRPLGDQYGIDFQEISTAAKKHNMRLGERMQLFLER